jgi:hypothetical protein
MPCPPWLDHSNNTWRRVEVMKLLIMQFSSATYHFILLRSTYSPQQNVLRQPQSPSETNFHIHTNPQVKL